MPTFSKTSGRGGSYYFISRPEFCEAQLCTCPSLSIFGGDLIILLCIVLLFIVMLCIVLLCIVLLCIVSLSIILLCIVLLCIVLLCIDLLCIVLLCICLMLVVSMFCYVHVLLCFSVLLSFCFMYDFIMLMFCLFRFKGVANCDFSDDQSWISKG